MTGGWCWRPIGSAHGCAACPCGHPYADHRPVQSMPNMLDCRTCEYLADITAYLQEKGADE